MIRRTILFSVFFAVSSGLADQKPELVFTTHAPRDEISPNFDRKDKALILTSLDQEGTNGYWQTKIPVEGGQTYSLSVRRKAEGIAHPRRSCAVRIEWEGAQSSPKKSISTNGPTGMDSAISDPESHERLPSGKRKRISRNSGMESRS